MAEKRTAERGNPLAPVGLLLVLNAIIGAVAAVASWVKRRGEGETNDAEDWQAEESFE